MGIKSTEQGFSQTDSIVLLLSFGILTILILPSFLSISHKPVQSEGRQYIGTMNRAQQAYFLENNQFSASIDKLGIGIQSETKTYHYSIQNYENYVLNYAIPKEKFTYKTQYYGIFPWRKKVPLDTYIGGVWWETETFNGKPEKIVRAILCQTNNLSDNSTLKPAYQNGKLTCPPGTIDLDR